MTNTSKLFIPDRIKVGFQNRAGTYSGKLAYVIYFDKTGAVRKERSWEGWRDKKIDPVEFDNKPTEGFVLNKGVGGQRASYGWNARNEYIRVYDPRDFEFEISVANLLFILKECDCSRGKGLEGKFVYSWDKQELVLLPVEAADFKQSQEFMALQDTKITKEEMIPGKTYLTKSEEELVYVGWYDYFQLTKKSKKYIFWAKDERLIIEDLKKIAKVASDEISPKLANLIDKFYKSPNGSKIVKLFLDEKHRWQSYPSAEEFDGSYSEYHRAYNGWHYSAIHEYKTRFNYLFKNGKVILTDNKYRSKREPSKYLWALLESGESYPINGRYLIDN